MCLDGYMNIALENAQEWSGNSMVQSYGDVFIRGNNGKRVCLMISDLYDSVCSVVYTGGLCLELLGLAGDGFDRLLQVPIITRPG